MSAQRSNGLGAHRASKELSALLMSPGHALNWPLLSWTWWYTPVIPTHDSSKQKDHMFEASLGYIARVHQTKQKANNNNKKAFLK